MQRPIVLFFKSSKTVACWKKTEKDLRGTLTPVGKEQTTIKKLEKVGEQY